MQRQLADKIYTERGEYHIRAYPENDDFKKYIDSILDFFADKKEYSILDAGAGEGLVTELLRDQGYQIDALDISKVAAVQFRDRIAQKRYASSVKFYCGDLLSFRKKYDWILCANTLHWMEDDKAAAEKLKKLARVGIYATAVIVPDNLYDMRGYTKDELLELFPGAEVYAQDNLRWVVIWHTPKEAV